MKQAKHQFVCEKCYTPCMVYKKGKNHRVLVCPKCGVLATNGLFKRLRGAVKGGLEGLPFVGGAIQGFNESRTIPSVSRQVGQGTGITRFDNLDKPNKGERYVHEALHGGRT